MEVSVEVESAREAFARGEWSTARDLLRTARESAELEPSDLERLSLAAWWLGDGVESMAVAEDVYRHLVEGSAPAEAAERALRLALEWTLRGDLQVGAGWLNRARRQLRDQPRAPAHGYLAYLEAGVQLDLEGDPVPAEGAAAELAVLAKDFDDPALACLSLVMTGLAALCRGETTAGFGDLDEAMLPVLAGRVEPMWAGDIYCSVIHLCEGLGDLARMRAWTDSLERWAAPLSRTFMYAGVTRVHQLQLISAEGGWDVVERELGERSESLVGSHGWLAGTSYYELGEVRRLRGDADGAGVAYAQARRLGVDPQPGEALLLRAEGRTLAAQHALRASLGELGTLDRARLLLPAAEVAIETGDLAYAETLAAELEATAEFFATPGLRARAGQARAAVLLAGGLWREAVPHLESAAQVYREQRFRYATAQVYEQLAVARRGMSQHAVADADLATALAIYRQLGARPDVERLSPSNLPGGLTAREVEVLACVASGASNREVARRLFISDKTVSRHLANIFTKIGVQSRTAASAWALAHGIHPLPHDVEQKLHDAPDEGTRTALLPSSHDS